MSQWMRTAGVIFLASTTCFAEQTRVDPHNSFLSCRTFSARADGDQPCVVRVTVHLANGEPAIGETVSLSSSRGNVDAIEPSSAVTDELGRTEFRVRSMKPGTATLSANCRTTMITKALVCDGAVAIYTFDGDSPAARVRDLSGWGNHGTLVGDPKFVVGRSGEAISLDGKSQYVSIPDHPSIRGEVGNHIEAWIKIPQSVDDTAIQIVAQKSFSHRGDYALSLHGHRIAYHYRSSQRAAEQLEEALSNEDCVQPGTWTQTAGFWEGSDIDERVRFHGYVRAYVSEETFDTIPRAQQLEGIWNGRNEGQPMSIGGNEEGTESFRGLIDEVRVYNRALYDEEMRRNHSGDASVTFGLSPPDSFASDSDSLPECVILSWEPSDPRVTTYEIYRTTTAQANAGPEDLLKVVPHDRDHFRDYEVNDGETYYYTIVANSLGNRSLPSTEIAATPRRADADPRWFLGDGHFHTFNHDIDVEDFTPELTLREARLRGWDFVLVTEHNSLGSYFRSEDQGTRDFIVFGNGQEISSGGDHRTGAFLSHFIPTSGRTVQAQNAMALAMGGEVGPNHSAYRNGPPNITLFELVNNRRWYPFDAWDNDYLKRGIPVTAKGGSDAHGRFSVKRGIRWCVWADRLSYRALKDAIRRGRTLAVDGQGLLCMLKVNGQMIGETVRVPIGTPLQIDVSAEADSGVISEVALVKFGETIQTWTPGRDRWSTTLQDGDFDGKLTYYRLEVRSKAPDLRAVSSAIFIADEASTGETSEPR